MVVEKSKVGDIFDGTADIWDDWAGPRASMHADTLLKNLEIMKGIKVLDVGCGTGIATFKLYDILGGDGNFHGIDISKAMIEQANKKSEKYENCFFKVGDAENIEYPDETFDLVISNMLIQYLSDQNRALTEMYRILKQDGKLALSYEGEYYGKPMYQAMKVVADRMGFHIAKATWEWVISNHKPVDLFYNMIEKAGFIDVMINAIYYLDHKFDFEKWVHSDLLKNYGYFRDEMSAQEVEGYLKEVINYVSKTEIFNTYYCQYCYTYATKP